MDFEETTKNYTGRIEKEVIALFESRRTEAWKYHPLIGTTYELLKEYVLRKGKRIASCSMLFVYQGYTGDADERIIKVAAGLELYRHAILIHDDLVDGDDMRRDGLAIHKQAELIFANNPERFSGDAAHFGRGFAVFAANLLFALALEVISSSGFDSKNISEAHALLIEDYRNVNESQILDLSFEGSRPTIEEWRTMAAKRASSLFTTTMGLGAVLAGASQDERKKIEEAASHVGYAFDIQDDIIGTFATDKQYGRSTASDIRAGKKPFHVIRALQSEGAEKIVAILGKKDASDDEISQVKEFLRANGLAPAKEESLSRAHSAKELIDKTSLNDDATALIAGIIQFVSESLEWYK